MITGAKVVRISAILQAIHQKGLLVYGKPTLHDTYALSEILARAYENRISTDYGVRLWSIHLAEKMRKISSKKEG